MLRQEKLLSAFILSAYDSGFCNHGLPEPFRNAHVALFEKFVLTGTYFPHNEILKTHPFLGNRAQKIGVRPYIYGEHLEKVEKNIESISGVPFLESIKNKPYLATALSCPVSAYHVLNQNQGKLVGKHLHLGFEKELIILPGLEIPERGDLISGHWNHYLEIMSDETIDKCLPAMEKYFSEIRKK